MCLLVAALASLLVSRRVKPAVVAGGAFALCWAWPIAALSAAYDGMVALEAAGHALAALPSDAVWLAARFAGMFGVIALLWRARLALHGKRPATVVESRGG